MTMEKRSGPRTLYLFVLALLLTVGVSHPLPAQTISTPLAFDAVVIKPSQSSGDSTRIRRATAPSRLPVPL